MAKPKSNDVTKQHLQGLYFTTWSPSALKSYEECPRKAALERLAKLCPFCFSGVMKRTCSKCGAEKPRLGEPLLRGNVIHAAAEAYVTGRPGLPKPKGSTASGQDEKVYLGTHAGKLAGKGWHQGGWYDFDLTAPKIKQLINTFKTGYGERTVRVELELAFTKSWRLTQWLARDVYVRFKADILAGIGSKLTRIWDWKSGRPKPHDYADQLRGYAVASLSAGFGDATEAGLAFTDHDLLVGPEECETGKLKRSDLAKAQKYLDQRAAPMFADQKFIPKPGHCTYCPYTANKGGPCQY